jgi:hypothetical protein
MRFEFSYELGVEGVVACLECFQRLVAAADQDAEQRDLLLNSFRRDRDALPPYAAPKTTPFS